jgi:hypothetical protein
MPDRTPAQARERFVVPLRRSLSCITNAQSIVSTIGKPGQPEALTLSEDPLRMRTLHGVEYQLRWRHGTGIQALTTLIRICTSLAARLAAVLTCRPAASALNR